MAAGAARVLSAPLIQLGCDHATAFNHSVVLYRESTTGCYQTPGCGGESLATDAYAAGWQVVERVSRPLDGDEDARALFQSAFQRSADSMP